MAARVSAAGWTPACFAAFHTDMKPCLKCPICDICKEARKEGRESLMIERKPMIYSYCDISVTVKELQQNVDEMKRRLR